MTLHWILFGSLSTGSSRIHGHRIHEELLRQGYDSRLLVAPPHDVQMYDLPWSNPERLAESNAIQEEDTVIFETVRGELAQRFAAALKRKGVKVCFLECDLYPESELANSASIILSTSRYLADEMHKRHPEIPIEMIPDPVEDLLRSDELPVRVRKETSGLRIAWMGQAGHWETLDEVRTILHDPEFRDMRLTTVSNHPQADLMWSPQTALSLLRSSDILVVPTSQSTQALAKSSNRVVQGMASGCVVLAGDLPAYREVIETGTNGFISRTSEEWREALRTVRDVGRRRSVVHKGHQRVAEEFGLAPITRRYAEVLGLTPSARLTDQSLPAGYLAEQSAEYACWYLAQHRYPEGLRWMTAACCREMNGAGFCSALRVLSQRCRRKLGRIIGNQDPENK